MKNLFTASILAVSVCLFSCSDNKNTEEYNRANPGTSTDMNTPAPATGDATNPFNPAPTMDPASTNPISQPVAQSPGKVAHYICPNGHADGGSDAGGTCKVCGAELAHNDAFHNQPAQTTPQQADPTSIQPQITPDQNTPPIEPAQNSSGVFHYVCAEGHAGGSATAENCAVCGKQLVHNDKYHQ